MVVSLHAALALEVAESSEVPVGVSVLQVLQSLSGLLVVAQMSQHPVRTKEKSKPHLYECTSGLLTRDQDW